MFFSFQLSKFRKQGYYYVRTDDPRHFGDRDRNRYFNPSIVGSEFRGAHECLTNAIFKSDMDLRKSLFGDIVLAGGTTMFFGFADRFFDLFQVA